jgi:hypothetical protein
MSRSGPNPFNWQGNHPRIEIPRLEVATAAENLREGGSVVVLGGRGMGKSVFLNQLRDELERTPGLIVQLIPGPPPRLSVDACLDQLAETLGVSIEGAPSSRKTFDAYFRRADAAEHLVLLFDELDRYAERSPGAGSPPGRGFFNDLEIARRHLPGLGVLATGSIGVFIFRDVLGSSFLSRALHARLRPFERSDADVLAAPFRDRGTALSDDVVDALFLASGGIPALLTFGFQQLWKLEREAFPADVTAIYRAFEEQFGEYLRDLLSALTEPRLSDAPLRVWERIQQGPGQIRRAELEACLGPPSGVLKLNLADALYLLEAVGVIRLEGSALRDDPVVAYPIAGLLNLPGSSSVEGDLDSRFLADLTMLLTKLQRSSADFFRSGPVSEGGGKRLVPESVFAAHLALGFELLGWRSEREAQRGAGRTDLLLRRNGAAEAAIIEVKIWGRNDYREAQRQVESYWTVGMTAGAVVQLTDAEITDWPDRYRRECLEACGGEVEELSSEGSSIAARFRCVTTTADGVEVAVEHFLVRLLRRR